jgi:hypothetical protein
MPSILTVSFTHGTESVVGMLHTLASVPRSFKAELRSSGIVQRPIIETSPFAISETHVGSQSQRYEVVESNLFTDGVTNSVEKYYGALGYRAGAPK